MDQLQARRLAYRIQGELGGAVNGVKRKRKMPGDTGYIDNRARSLLLHHWDHRLHRSNGAEEIGIKRITACRHIHLLNRVQHSVTGIVYPNIDPAKMMQRERDHAINLLTI